MAILWCCFFYCPWSKSVTSAFHNTEAIQSSTTVTKRAHNRPQSVNAPNYKPPIQLNPQNLIHHSDYQNIKLCNIGWRPGWYTATIHSRMWFTDSWICIRAYSYNTYDIDLTKYFHASKIKIVQSNLIVVIHMIWTLDHNNLTTSNNWVEHTNCVKGIF